MFCIPLVVFCLLRILFSNFIFVITLWFYFRPVSFEWYLLLFSSCIILLGLVIIWWCHLVDLLYSFDFQYYVYNDARVKTLDSLFVYKCVTLNTIIKNIRKWIENHECTYILSDIMHVIILPWYHKTLLLLFLLWIKCRTHIEISLWLTVCIKKETYFCILNTKTNIIILIDLLIHKILHIWHTCAT